MLVCRRANLVPSAENEAIAQRARGGSHDSDNVLTAILPMGHLSQRQREHEVTGINRNAMSCAKSVSRCRPPVSGTTAIDAKRYCVGTASHQCVNVGSCAERSVWKYAAMSAIS